MGYEVLGLLLGCGALALLMALLIVPFIALYRTKRIGEISERLRALEREVAQLRRDPTKLSARVETAPEAGSRTESLAEDRPRARLAVHFCSHRS